MRTMRRLVEEGNRHWLQVWRTRADTTQLTTRSIGRRNAFVITSKLAPLNRKPGLARWASYVAASIALGMNIG